MKSGGRNVPPHLEKEGHVKVARFARSAECDWSRVYRVDAGVSGGKSGGVGVSREWRTADLPVPQRVHAEVRQQYRSGHQGVWAGWTFSSESADSAAGHAYYMG